MQVAAILCAHVPAVNRRRASEGRQDPRGQLRRAAAIDQLEHVVQVDLGVGGELLCERSLEAGLSEDVAAPGLDVWRDAAARRSVQVGVHVQLAPPGALVLPA